MDVSLLVALQAAHLLLAVYWLGSVIFTELMLWPRMKAAGVLAQTQSALRTPNFRKIMGVAVFGTVLTGYLRGIAGGVFDDLYSLHGVLFIAAALLGSAMMVWWAMSPPKAMQLGWRLWYAGFAVIFALMIGLRFSG